MTSSKQIKDKTILTNTTEFNGYLSHNITHGHVSHAHLTARKRNIKRIVSTKF
jgi:hypothetical protein